jgi:hypothetical protein
MSSLNPEQFKAGQKNQARIEKERRNSRAESLPSLSPASSPSLPSRNTSTTPTLFTQTQTQTQPSLEHFNNVLKHIIELINALHKTIELQGQAIPDLSVKLDKNTKQIENNTNVVGDLDIATITEKVNNLSAEGPKGKDLIFAQYTAFPPAQKKKDTYAKAAKRAPTTTTTTKPKSTIPKNQVLFNPNYTRVNREVIVQLSFPCPATTSTDSILTIINTACSTHKFVFFICPSIAEG